MMNAMNQYAQNDGEISHAAASKAVRRLCRRVGLLTGSLHGLVLRLAAQGRLPEDGYDYCADTQAGLDYGYQSADEHNFPDQGDGWWETIAALRHFEARVKLLYEEVTQGTGADLSGFHYETDGETDEEVASIVAQM